MPATGFLPRRSAGRLAFLAAALALAAIAVPAAEEDRAAGPRGASGSGAEDKGTALDGAGDVELTSDPQYAEFLKVNYVFNRELYDLCIPRYEKILEARPRAALESHVHYALGLCHYNLAIRKDGGITPPEGTEAGAGTAKEGGAAARSDARDEHVTKAVSHLKEAIKNRKFPLRISATFTLGQALLLAGDPASAAKTFQVVADRKPPPPEASAARLGLADARYAEGKHAEAATAYRDALKDAGDQARRVRFYLAVSLYHAAAGAAAPPQLEECARIFEEVAADRDSPFAAEALYMSALLCQKRGDDAGAADRFRRLVDSGADAHAELGRFGLASSLSRTGRHAEAADAWQAFLQEHPGSEKKDLASLYLARALAEMGKTAAAVRILQEIRTAPSCGDEAALTLARISITHAQPGAAISVLRTAIKAFPRSPRRQELELELASAQIAGGDVEAADKTLAGLDAEASVGDHAAYLKAYALHRARKYGAAIEACADFEARFPRSTFRKPVAQLRAESSFLAGRYEEAGVAYVRYLEDFAKELDEVARLRARLRVAQARVFEKRYEEARSDLLALVAPTAGAPAPTAEVQRALREDPLLVSAPYLLGECAYRLRDPARAAEEFRKFLAAADALPASVAEGLRDSIQDARFKLGHSLELAGDRAGAKAAYGRALELDPESPHRSQVRFELGQIALAEKDRATARAFLEQVAAEDSSGRLAPHALRLLGWLAHDEGRYDEAVARYAKVAESFPQHEAATEAEFQLAESLRAAGRAQESAEAMRQFAGKHPEDPRAGRALLGEAEALSAAGKHSEALGSLTKLRADPAAKPMLPRVLYEVAWCHRGLGDLAAAERAYEELLALPDAGAVGETARLELAELELEQKRYARAKDILEPLVSGDAPREKALYRLVWCHHLLEEHDATTAAFERFRKAFPASALGTELAILSAKADLAAGRSEKAAETLSAIADGPPESEATQLALVSLGEALSEARKFKEARTRFQTFLDGNGGKSPIAYRARFGLAWCEENLGDLGKAVDLYRAVLQETSTATAARAQFQIGQCLAAQQKYKDAIVEFLQVPAMFPYPEWSARAVLQAGGCFEALGDVENAKKHYKEVSDTYPDRDEARLAGERLEKLQLN